MHESSLAQWAREEGQASNLQFPFYPWIITVDPFLSLRPSSMAPPGKRKKKQLDQAKKLAKKINFVPLDPEAIDCDWWDTFWQRNSSLSGSLSIDEIALGFRVIRRSNPYFSLL